MSLRCFNRKIVYQCDNLRLYNTKKGSYSTAGIVVVGDEILNGTVADTNSPFLAKALHKLGLKLKKISVIPDNVHDISEEVRHFSNRFEYVLTTGGIGPTHDDVTYEGVARAFREPLVLHPELKEICSKFYKTNDPFGAGMKLALVPQASRLHYLTTSGSKLPYPNVAVHNVYMFPGIPELLQRTIRDAGPLLFKSDSRFFTKYLLCSLPEHQIINQLKQLVDEFPDCQFGCYPKLFNSLYKVKVTVVSSSEETTQKAYSKLIQLIPPSSVVNKLDDM